MIRIFHGALAMAAGLVLLFTPASDLRSQDRSIYLLAGVGWSNANDADLREDNPNDPNCFLFIVFPGTCGNVLDDLGHVVRGLAVIVSKVQDQ